MKHRLRAFIARWELTWYAITATAYFIAVPATIALFPNVSNLWLSVLVLFSGFTAAIGSAASAIKTKDNQ